MLSQQSYSSISLFLFFNTLNSKSFVSYFQKLIIARYKLKEVSSESHHHNQLLKSLASKVINHQATLNYEEFKKQCDLSVKNISESHLRSWFEVYPRLSGAERVTLILSLFLKKTDAEVAFILSVSEGTVRYRVSNSLLKLSKGQK